MQTGIGGEGAMRTPEAAAAPKPPAKLSLSPLWLLFAALALAIPVGALLAPRARHAALPDLGALPDFSLTDQRGQPFRSANLRGRVWLADFVFTSCADVCPLLTQKMRSLQDRLTPEEQAGAIGLLSLTVDPERDTPEKLAAYARTFGAREGTWSFLTGPQADVERAVVKGFRIAMQKVPLDPAQAAAAAGESAADVHAQAFDILHGAKFVLVDARGHLRGYYDADGPGLDRMLRDARQLAREGA